MRKIVITLLVVLGLALLVVGISLKAFPQWLAIPGGVASLLVAALLGVAELGGKLKDWRDVLCGEKKEAEPTLTASESKSPMPQRTQEMSGSEKGRQEMHGKGGAQKQKMTDSPGGKQKMD